MGRKAVIVLLVGLALAPFRLGEAQQPKKVPRIGFLVSGSPSSTREVGEVEAFHQGLRELGYVEGQNIAIEYRYDDGVEERLLNLATELVQLR
jgi:putative tryptophan/tyrosine transport system substrate-binding protein